MKLVKKLFILGLGLGVFLFLLVLVTNYFWPEFYTPPTDYVPAELIVSFPNEGRSMEPTLQNGDKLSYNVSLKPEVGNIVAFDCFTQKCINGKTPNKVKRLVGINEQGCYWFEGDNKNFSWDSRNYGWLCGADVKILGVVVQ